MDVKSSSLLEDGVEQEEDEDKLDMDGENIVAICMQEISLFFTCICLSLFVALAEHFPDLCMVELINREDPPTPVAVSPTHISPAYVTHLQNLSTVAARYGGKSLLLQNKGKIFRLKMAQSMSQPQKSTGASHEGTKFRLRRPASPANQRRNYSTCVKQQLKRYCTS